MTLKTWLIVLEIMFSELSAKKGLNTLNEIKNAEIINYEKRTPIRKESLNLFRDLLDTILTDKTLKSEGQKDENENKNDNENDENENENGSDNANENDDETMSQNEKIKLLNDLLDEIIDKSKSFEDQIESLEKVENLEEYYVINDFGDKELEFKIFILKPHTVIWTNIWSYTWNISK